MQTNAPVNFEFVVGNRPDQLNAATSRRLRSYLSKRAWQAYRAPSSSSSSSSSGLSTDSSTLIPTSLGRRSRKRRNAPRYSVTFEGVLGSQPRTADRPALSTPQEAQPSVDLAAADPDLGAAANVLQHSPLQPVVPPVLSVEYRLGGGRVDPFRSTPGQWRPSTPALVDHYIVHMAVDIPELDQQGHPGLLRSSWFPLVVSEAAAFRVIMLLSASNYASVNNVLGLACQLLQLKSEAIRCINAAFRDGEKRLGDGMIGAVAKMASFEAMYGDVASYRMHMEGLRRMVDMRGGLHTLGLDGLLRRIIVWIDVNSSFLLQVPRYFPGHTFTGEETPEPNPERFIAV